MLSTRRLAVVLTLLGFCSQVGGQYPGGGGGVAYDPYGGYRQGPAQPQMGVQGWGQPAAPSYPRGGGGFGPPVGGGFGGSGGGGGFGGQGGGGFGGQGGGGFGGQGGGGFGGQGGGGFGGPGGGGAGAVDIAMTEEQMAETLSETAAGSQERRRLEGVIKRNGGRLTGQAAPLNYLVQEYLLTTPIPLLAPTNNHFRQWMLANHPPPEAPPPQKPTPARKTVAPAGRRGMAPGRPGLAGRGRSAVKAGAVQQEMEPGEGPNGANGQVAGGKPSSKRAGNKAHRGRAGIQPRRNPAAAKTVPRKPQVFPGAQLTQWQQKFSGRSTPYQSQPTKRPSIPQQSMNQVFSQGTQPHPAPVPRQQASQLVQTQQTPAPQPKAKTVKRRPAGQQTFSILGERLRMIQERIDKLVTAQKGIVDSNQNYGLQQQINKLMQFKNTLQGKQG